MVATILEYDNLFEPLKPGHSTQLRRPRSIRSFLRLRFGPDFVEFALPTIILVNGRAVVRRLWTRTILRDGDVMTIITIPGWTQIIYYVVLLLVATVAAMAMSRAVPNLQNGKRPQAEPIFTLRGQNNQVRLNDPIEVAYGRNRMWPSYAAQPYNQYIDNDQWLFQLFCVGQGKFAIESVLIADTPIGNFLDVSYEIVAPGGLVTLFPTNVKTSPDVSNIELLGTNQTGYASLGPYVANAAGTLCHRLEIDVSLPAGLYKANPKGGLDTLTVTALFEAQEIDSAGTPVGSWFTIATFVKTLATVNIQRFTLAATVTAARYRVRGSRTNVKDLDSGAGNTLVWDGFRAFLPNVNVYGNVTMMAVKARATNNLNDNSAHLFNLFATRILPVWNGASWVEQPTRNGVWAFCDIYKATYGGRFIDAYLGLPALLSLAATWDARGDSFDWIYDQPVTLWDASKLLGLAGRANPTLNGTQVTLVRDDVQTIPEGMYGPDNMVKGSFQWQIKLPGFDYNDGYVITYTDPATWKPETVDCFLGFEAGDNPLQLTLQGITDRAQAYREGMYIRAVAFYLRENIIFHTGLEGHIPSFGAMILLAVDIPRWATAGLVKAVSGPVWVAGPGVTKTLKLSNAVAFTVGPTYKLALRYKDGTMKGPWTVTAGVDTQTVKLVGITDWPEDMPFDNINEFPMFFFGVSTSFGYKAKVLGVRPSTDDTVEILCCNYDETIFTADGNTPPALGDTHGQVPVTPQRPAVTGLKVTVSPNLVTQAVASWESVPGALYYVLQLSYDGTSWTNLGGGAHITANHLSFAALPVYLWVRVAAVGVGQGNWNTWMGDSPVNLVDPNSNGELVLNPDFSLGDDGSWESASHNWSIGPALGEVSWGANPNVVSPFQLYNKLHFKCKSGDRFTVRSHVKGASCQARITFFDVNKLECGYIYAKLGSAAVWSYPEGSGNAPDNALYGRAEVLSTDNTGKVDLVRVQYLAPGIVYNTPTTTVPPVRVQSTPIGGSSRSITLLNDDPAAAMHYQINGGVVTAYSAPFVANAYDAIDAYATRAGYTPSQSSRIQPP